MKGSSLTIEGVTIEGQPLERHSFFKNGECVAQLVLEFHTTKFAEDDMCSHYYLYAHTNKGGDLVSLFFNDVKKAEEQMLQFNNFIHHVSDTDEYLVEDGAKSYTVKIEKEKKEDEDEIPF